MLCTLVVFVRTWAPQQQLARPGGFLLSPRKALALPMKWIVLVLMLWLMSSTARAGEGYWDADYEVLARSLPQLRADTARLRLVQRVKIRVRDNGAGLPGYMKKQVFQPFFTIRPVLEGTGLDLSLSHAIVTKGHGGTLTAESGAGQGTEFLIILSA